jgi:oxygen-independent coproporphyrinogen-3 oxidase
MALTEPPSDGRRHQPNAELNGSSFSPTTSFDLPGSLYVHVPFCARRCGYCNFTLLADRSDLIDKYLDAIELELRRVPASPPLQTLFVGGGTPNLLDSAQLARLFALIRSCFSIATDCEFSVEANPDLLTADQCRQLSAHGVNRLSLGGQSFDDSLLKQLDRDHSGQQLLDAATLAGEHFQTTSIDLIFSIPNQTLDQWQRDLNRLVASGVQHVSCYGLTIEKGTRLYADVLHNRVQPLPDDRELEMYQLAIAQLVAAGFEHYEVSSFAKQGHACRHNQIYWTGQRWWGIGAGAAEFVGHARRVNHRSTTEYIKRQLNGIDPIGEIEELSDADLAIERLVFGLRQLAGIDWTSIKKGFHAKLADRTQQLIESDVAAGWLESDGAIVKLTRAGLFVSDTLWPKYFQAIEATCQTDGNV